MTTPKTFTLWNHEGLTIFADNLDAQEFGIAVGSLPDGPYIKFTHILIDDVTHYGIPVAEFAAAAALMAQWDNNLPDFEIVNAALSYWQPAEEIAA